MNQKYGFFSFGFSSFMIYRSIVLLLHMKRVFFLVFFGFAALSVLLDNDPLLNVNTACFDEQITNTSQKSPCFHT